MIFNLQSRYRECEQLLAARQTEWGDDPYFVPRFRAHARNTLVEAVDGVFRFYLTHHLDHPFALLSHDHVLIRFPDHKRRANTERRKGGAYESGILHSLFNVRVYAGNPRQPGYDFMAMHDPRNIRVHTTEWVWSDGAELRPWGTQVERVLDRKALKSAKEHIAKVVDPARVVARLTESSTDAVYYHERGAAQNKALELIVSGADVDPAEMRTLLAQASGFWGGERDDRKIDTTLHYMREDLWRRLGAVKFVETEAA